MTRKNLKKNSKKLTLSDSLRDMAKPGLFISQTTKLIARSFLDFLHCDFKVENKKQVFTLQNKRI